MTSPHSNNTTPLLLMFNFLQRMRIATKLWLLIAIFTSVGVADNLTEMALVRDRLHLEKEIQLKHLVDTAHTLLQSYESAAREGRLPEHVARAQAAEAIRQLHYGPREYFWIHDLSQPTPKMVMHPTVPSLNGRTLDEAHFNRATALQVGHTGTYQPLSGINLFVAMNQAIAKTGDGFVTYDWPKPLAEGGVSEQRFPKLSYVKRFDAWGWVIGSGIYIDDLHAEYWRDIQIRLLKAGLWLLLLGALVWFITRTVIQPMQAFQRAIDDLRANPNHPLGLASTQPGELGRLTQSFEALIEDLRRSRSELTITIDKLRVAARSFASMKEGVMVTDAAGKILSVNPAFVRRSGYEPEALIGQQPNLLRSERHDAAFYSRMWSQIQTTGQWTGEIWNKNKDGRSYGQWLTIQSLRDRSGNIQSYVGIYSDLEDENPG